MKETDIRPDELREEQQKAVQADIAWLQDRKQHFEAVPCHACEHGGFSKTMFKRGFMYRTCAKCGTMYMTPRPTPQLLSEFYAQSQNNTYWAKSIFPASEKVRCEEICQPRARRIVQIDRTIGSVMDIGAGYGTFLMSFPVGFFRRRMIALEPNHQQAEICRSKGLEVYESTFEDFVLPNFKVDCITAFEVIEHTFSPKNFIMKCQQVLIDNGLLVLTCPNINGFDIATLGEISNSIDHEHINYFNPESLSLLVKSCGFEIIEVTTPGKLDAELVRKKVLSGDFNLNGQPFLQKVLIDKWDTLGEPFQRFLADNGLSSHLWLVARKI